jgi:DNA-binding GntR family transcriptional regulator
LGAEKLEQSEGDRVMKSLSRRGGRPSPSQRRKAGLKAQGRNTRSGLGSKAKTGHPLRLPDEARGEYAYRVMREALRSGAFRSGEHLREADVAKRLRISRTPVREAFHRLVAEGLLNVGRWNGVVVAELSAAELVQLYAVREALEGTAARLAAEHATAAEIERLSEIADAEAAAKTDPDRLVIINSQLHQTIYAAAHNRYLLQALNTVVDTLGLLRHSTFVLPGSIELAHREHLKIIGAIRKHRPDHAEDLARQHIRHALAMRLKLPQPSSAAIARPAPIIDQMAVKRAEFARIDA